MEWVKRTWRYLLYFGKGFIHDNCIAKASALSFYSLLSIVPFVAILFGIAQAVGFGGALETAISTRFDQQPEVSEKLIEFARSSLENAQGGIIAGVGFVALLWSALGLLNNIENTLNEIWKAQKERSYFRKIRDYLIVLATAPLFLIASSTINIFVSTQIQETAEGHAVIEAISPFLLYVFPFILTWALLTFIYVFMPNIKVRVKDATIAAIIAGTAFQLWQWIYIQFQVGVSSYGAIYGSFAALPLFLIWLQISWIIVLAGAELVVTPY